MVNGNWGQIWLKDRWHRGYSAAHKRMHER
jgi:hypothetical protein